MILENTSVTKMTNRIFQDYKALKRKRKINRKESKTHSIRLTGSTFRKISTHTLGEEKVKMLN